VPHGAPPLATISSLNYLPMSGLGQTRKSAVAIVRSGLPLKADSTRTSRHVRKVPNPEGAFLLDHWPRGVAREAARLVLRNATQDHLPQHPCRWNPLVLLQVISGRDGDHELQRWNNE
jgi:hypothetical protein